MMDGPEGSSGGDDNKEGSSVEGLGGERVRRQEEGPPAETGLCACWRTEGAQNVAGAQRVWARQEVNSEREMGVWGRHS